MGGGASSNASAVPKDAKSNNASPTLSDQHHQLDQYEESPFDDTSMNKLDALDSSSDSNKKSQVASATKLKRMAFGQQSYMDQHRDYDQTLSQIALNSTVTVDWVAPTPSPTRLVQKISGSPDIKKPGEGFFSPTSTGASAAVAFHTPGGSSSLKKPPPPSMRPPNVTPLKHQQQVQGDPTHTAVHAPQFIRTPPPNITFPVPQQVLQNSTANFKHAIISSGNSIHSPVHNPNNHMITPPVGSGAAGAMNKPLPIHKSPAADHQLDTSNSSYDDDDMIADFSSHHERAVTDEVHSPNRKVPPLDLIHVSANSSSSHSLHQSAHSYSNSSLKQPISVVPSLGSQAQLLLAQKRLTSATTNGSSYPTLVNHAGGQREEGSSSSIAATQNQRGGLHSRPPAPSISSLPAVHNSNSPPLIAPVSSDALSLNPSNNNHIPQSSGGGGAIRIGATASSKTPPMGSSGSKLPNIGNTPSMGGAAPPVVKETKNVKRNKAQLPTTLTHAKPTTGDWLNKRYIVNNYILLEILGTGSYGEVRLCKDRTTDKLFAIKIFSKDFLKKKKTGSKSDETFFEDIRREIAIMKKLLHPNILRLFEVLDDPKVNKMYLVLEYMKMGDLVNVLKTRSEGAADSGADMESGSSFQGGTTGSFTPLTDLEVWNIFRQVVSGIRYLHYQNVVHGDIKPQNLLLGDDGLVKIADFGISQMLSASGQKLADAAGTPAFMSPELCQGQSFSGQLADIWAIGATMFMLKFGHPPFLAKSIINLYVKIINDPLVFPSPIDPGLKNLLENLLVKDPTKRYTLQQIIMHPWFRHPPSLSKAVANKQDNNMSINKQENNMSINKQDNSNMSINSQRLSSTTTSMQNNTSARTSSTNQSDAMHVLSKSAVFNSVVSFKPPDYYEAEEQAAMTVQVTIDNHEELFKSIGGIKRSAKVNKSDVDGKINEEVVDSDDDEVDEDTAELDTKAARNGIEAMKSADSRDIMETNWGADVFEMIDDGDDSDDDNDSVDEDDFTESAAEEGKKITIAVDKVGSSESLKSVPHDEMSQEEQEKRSRRFINKITRKSVENILLQSEPPSTNNSPAKPNSTKNEENNTSQSLLNDRGTAAAAIVGNTTPTHGSNQAFFPSSAGGAGGSGGKVVKLPIRTTAKKTIVRDLSGSESFNNYLDIDEEMEDLNSIEDFNKMMDTLALQPKEAKQRREEAEAITASRGGLSTPLQVGGFTAAMSNPTNCTALSTCSDRGSRSTQEDRYITIPNVAAMKILEEFRMSEVTLRQLDHFSIACVFDGHSGWRCSHFLSQHFATMLVRHDKFLSDKQIDTAIREVCSTLDKKVCDILTDEEDASGSTGVIAVVDGRRGCITAANVGDSLCVLCRSGKAVVLNRMHRLDDAEERDRVKRAGGTIINNRVNGILAISRAFGDIQFKPERDSKAQIAAASASGPIKGDASLLVADPDICTEKITQGTQFAVIASDGLWDVMSPQVVVDYVLNALHTHKDLDIVNTMITKEALRRGSIDNITVSLMAFHFKAPVANSDGGHS